ncbi:septation protein SepH [Compostimonas suwonensis]|uniref:DUF3071 domain-containing protein n=1 Tax=Compostimonas suwonensis TaxID=1048394 RepID=A0A2M9BBK9_9MICO|nr:septation protein SepH [Compostimonas suwonensis]PJJ55335.1 Protein of unknown function (DUF3071) [Compostimonas suwonensis]
MQDLKVIGVENGALLVASDDGDRYRIAIDEVLQSKLRQSTPESPNSRKVSPREIQTHVRSGMSAEDVARLTGASLEYVQRFEGPVLAEREYIVSSALGVPVHTAIDPDPLDPDATFGVVIRERLASLSATGERWASWKEPEGGWIVKLAFTADEIDHDARWSFEPKKLALAPLNAEAMTLSQQGELPSTLIPRLRAVTPESSSVDESRFDSGAFTFRDTSNDDSGANDTAPHLEHVPYGRSASPSANAVSLAAIKRAQEPPEQQNQTADLLEALRKRRGERESAGFGSDEESPAREESAPTFLDLPLSATERAAERAADKPAERMSEASVTESARDAQRAPVAQTKTARKGRASMPSWDEIVFGARTDDDLA